MKRIVVITGASTGIGYATAKELIARGYHVFGSVRKEADGRRVQSELGMLACEQISPQEAKRIGLITDHFPEAEFVTKVHAYAERLARRSVTACSETRYAIHHGYEMELTRGLALEMSGIVRCFNDSATQAALADYADYLQAEVMDKPDAPASIAEISQAIKSERFTRHFSATVSPKPEN